MGAVWLGFGTETGFQYEAAEGIVAKIAVGGGVGRHFETSDATIGN